jgi:hypothetical protein
MADFETNGFSWLYENLDDIGWGISRENRQVDVQNTA